MPGPRLYWRQRAGDGDGRREAPPPQPGPSRARRLLLSLALARVAPPRGVRASVGPERDCGAAGCRQRGARPGGGDGVAGGASEPGDSKNAMAPIGLKAVVGESKWRPGAARGPAKPVIQAPPSREGCPSGFLRPAGVPGSSFTQIPSSPRSSSPQTPPRSLSISSSSHPSSSHLAFINIPFFLFTFIPSPPSRPLSFLILLFKFSLFVFTHLI